MKTLFGEDKRQTYKALNVSMATAYAELGRHETANDIIGAIELTPDEVSRLNDSYLQACAIVQRDGHFVFEPTRGVRR